MLTDTPSTMYVLLCCWRKQGPILIPECISVEGILYVTYHVVSMQVFKYSLYSITKSIAKQTGNSVLSD